MIFLMQNGSPIGRINKMDDYILITQLNDFIFCPASIYFHNLYGSMDRILYQGTEQLNGTKAHEKVDTKQYSSAESILMGLDVFCEKYGLIGKIDIYDEKKKILRERKRQIKNIYDGYVFQLYAQYFALKEMEYAVEHLQLYSMVDNKIYKVLLPEQDSVMLEKFESVIAQMRSFKMEKGFVQTNPSKCERCIYEPACDRRG